jgi:hypothetical protein
LYLILAAQGERSRGEEAKVISFDAQAYDEKRGE